MLKVSKILIDRQENPAALSEPTPYLGWQLESDRRNVHQTAYRICIRDGLMPFWDSGRITGSESAAVRYAGPPLNEECHYTLELTVWDNHGESAQGKAEFSTALFAPRFLTAQWITHTLADNHSECPVFVRHFSAEPVQKARLYLSACGIYTVRLNGQEVSQDWFAPGWTEYASRLQYQVYDVTALIQPENTLEITTANGWYAGYLNGTRQVYGKQTAIFAELSLTCMDSHRVTVATDARWQWYLGQHREAEFYHGERIDRTAVPTAPQPVVLAEDLNAHAPALVPQQCEPVRVLERRAPVQLLHTPDGTPILDFGQNMAGVVRLDWQGSPGQEITLRFAEALTPDGSLYTANLRTAKATDTFVCSGGKDTFVPRFTYHGFRYVSIAGMGGNPPLDAFTALVLGTDAAATAQFSCSSPLVNRLWANIVWGQRSNFVDVPTDCPQRDERLGWTGDAAVFCRTAAQNEDVYRFFRKWLADLAIGQAADGGVPHIVPNVNGQGSGGAAVWCDAAVTIPWTLYELYGERDILEWQYPSMKAWVESMRRQETPDHLRQCGFQHGDWLALDREEGRGNRGSTDAYLIASAYYAHCTQLLAKAAAVLGKAQEADEYTALHRAICSGFQQEYITATGRVVGETQTALALILLFDLAGPEHRDRIAQSLVQNLDKHQGHLTTGFIGTPILMDALSKIGRNDLAGKLLLNEDFPGWLYEVRCGATTMWERWDSVRPDGSFDESGMNSFNHYAFGAVGDWLLEQLVGIRPAEPGYRAITLQPQLIQGITQACALRTTPYGRVRLAWQCLNHLITVEVEIPANTTAQLFLPEQEGSITLGSGSYQYSYATETDLTPQRFTMDTPLRTMLADADAKAVLSAALPGMLDGPAAAFLAGKSFNDLKGMMPGGEALFAQLLTKLNQLC